MPQSIFHVAAVLVAAVILLLALISGTHTGQAEAGSARVLANAGELAKGLKYFYNDQERYPSVPEYQAERGVMLNYFDSFPPQSIAGGTCASSFSYQRPSVQAFKLLFCLPTASGGFASGWNVATQDSK